MDSHGSILWTKAFWNFGCTEWPIVMTTQNKSLFKAFSWYKVNFFNTSLTRHELPKFVTHPAAYTQGNGVLIHTATLKKLHCPLKKNSVWNSQSDALLGQSMLTSLFLPNDETLIETSGMLGDMQDKKLCVDIPNKWRWKAFQCSVLWLVSEFPSGCSRNRKALVSPNTVA